MRVLRANGIGCAGNASCPCMPNTGMANGFNIASTQPGIPADKIFGAFDTSMSSITFPSAGANPLSIIAQPDGTFSVVSGTPGSVGSQTVASGLTQPQATDFVNQNGPGASVLANNPVAANNLSGNPMMPSIVGTDDGSGMINPGPPDMGPLCDFATAVNNNPLMTLAALAGVMWLLHQHKKGRQR